MTFSVLAGTLDLGLAKKANATHMFFLTFSLLTNSRRGKP